MTCRFYCVLNCHCLCSSCPELDLNQYGVSLDDSTTITTAGLFSGAKSEISVCHLLQALEKTYCGTVGAEFEHLPVRLVISWMVTLCFFQLFYRE